MRLRLYLFTGVVAGVGAYLLGLGVGWSVALGVVAPLVLAATPSFIAGTFAGLRAAHDPAEAMSGTEFE
ncbi:restriction endonuclease, partial [Mycolicibacterium elephantis]